MALKPNSIEIIGNQTIGGFLAGKIGLCVPPSQRSYRWKREHVEALCEDIKDNLLIEEYFVGSIVVIRSDDGKQTFVFDGQQRLATTMILIAAIRDEFLNLKDEAAAGRTERATLFSEDRETGEPSPHFILNTEDQSFFHDRVLRRPDDDPRKSLTKKANTPQNEKNILPQSHQRIEAAAKLVSKFVKDNIVKTYEVEEAKSKLHQWLNYIDESLRAIEIRVTDEKTAFTIFETMNDRGLRLSASDLLKNRLYAIAGKRREEVIQKWQGMTSVLEAIEGEEEGVLEYVRYFWVAHNGQTRTKDLYDKMKGHVKTPAQAVDLSSRLERLTPDYAAILLSSHPKWASWPIKTRTQIETIRLLGVTQLRPVLLAAIGGFTKKEFNALLNMCVSWSVRSLLGGVPSGTVESSYAKLARKITNGEVKTATEAKKEMAGLVPDNKSFSNSVRTVRVAQQKLARYYLHAMQEVEDRKKSKKKQKHLEYIPNPGDDITLEYILPEKPRSGEWDQFSAEEKKQYVHRLGNLVLLTGGDNSSVGSVEYIDKEPTLSGSKLSLTSMTGGKMIWRKQEIDERQEYLAKLAVETWPL